MHWAAFYLFDTQINLILISFSIFLGSNCLVSENEKQSTTSSRVKMETIQTDIACYRELNFNIMMILKPCLLATSDIGGPINNYCNENFVFIQLQFTFSTGNTVGKPIEKGKSN